MDDVAARCKERATQAMEMFLRNLSHVPKDKATWSPTPTAKSALRIGAHCAGYSGGFASIIAAGKFPPTVEEFLGPIEAAIEGIGSLEQAEAVLREGMAETLAALDAVRPEQFGAVIETPIGPTPFQFFMDLPATHLLVHTGQIDYLQTCWGDLEVYF